MIGIVGGIGPLAGLDLCRKIIQSSFAIKDQEHIPIVLLSKPNEIPDRTEYLEDDKKENPGYPIAKIILALGKTGATAVGIACNTAHAPKIFEVICDELKKEEGLNIKVLNIIEETINFTKKTYPKIKNIGVLCTNGTYKFSLYSDALLKENFNPIILDSKSQSKYVHSAIYNSKYGIKSNSEKVKKEAIKRLDFAIKILKKNGAKCLILGCTEIALIRENLNLKGLKVIDPTLILAKALIRETFPEKLKSL